MTEGETASRPAAPAFHLYLHAGDELDPDFGDVLGRAIGHGRVEMVTFDLLQQEAEAVRPVFLPGRNPTFARSAPAFYSRFGIADTAHVATWRTMAASEIMCAWIDAVPPHLLRGRWRHAKDFPMITAGGTLTSPVA